VVREISDSDSYGFIELMTSEDGAAIGGGIGGGARYESHAVFYVGGRMLRLRFSERRASAGRG
jgi:hypothetical protein